MAIEKMAFSPSNLWKDTASFPNKQDETKNRDMLNSGHMQTKAFINDLIDQLESTTEDASGSSLIGAYAIEGLKNEDETDAETVKDQIEALKRLIDSVDNTRGEEIEGLTSDLSDLSDEVDENYTTLDEKIDSCVSTINASIASNVSTLNASIDLKANASDVYTKSATDELLNVKANASEVYTTSATDALLNAKADKSTTYTKTDTDTLLSAKANSSDVTSSLALKADASSVYSKTAIDAKVDMTNGAIASINQLYNAKGDITLEGGTGITITVDNTNKKIIITSTGQATPGAHASSHEENGTDEIDAKKLIYGDSTLKSELESISSDVSDNASDIEDIIDGTTTVASATNATKLNDHDDTYFATATSVTNITDGTTTVGNASKLNNQSASYYATASSVSTNTSNITTLQSKTNITTNTLDAGDTEITFTNANITTDTIFSFYTSIYGVNPTEVSVSSGSVTLTFDAQEEDMEVGVRLDG